MKMFRQPSKVLTLQVLRCGTVFVVLVSALVKPIRAEHIEPIAQAPISNLQDGNGRSILTKSVDQFRSQKETQEFILKTVKVSEQLTDSGQLKQALQISRDLLEKIEKIYGKDSPYTAVCQINLAETIGRVGGSPLEALNLYAKARKIYGLEENDIGSANLLIRSAQMLSYIDDYPQAKDNFNEALGFISKSDPSLTTPSAITARLGIIKINSRLGYHEKAASDLEEIASAQKSWELYLDLADEYIKIDNLYKAREALRKARDYYGKNIASERSSWIRRSFYLVEMSLLLSQKQYSKAIETGINYLGNARNQRVENVIAEQFQLGDAYAASGNCKKAAEYFEKLEPTIRDGFGEMSLTYKNSLQRLAWVHACLGDHKKSITELDQINHISSSNLRRQLLLYDESARAKYKEMVYSSDRLRYWLTEKTSEANTIAINARLNFQGILQEYERATVQASKSPEIADALKEMIYLTKKGDDLGLPETTRDIFKQKGFAILQALSTKIDIPAQKEYSANELSRLLPKRGVLIEFQKYQKISRFIAGQESNGEIFYVGLILKPDSSIQVVQLGPADAIDQAVRQGLSSSAENQADATAAWDRVSTLIIKPLLPFIIDSNEWFISPDSELNRIPFTALTLPQKPAVYLADAVQLRQLTTGRDLIRLQQTATRGQASVVFANPDYGHMAQIARRQSSPTEEPIAQRRSSDLGSSTWNPLPGTVLEGQRVATMLSARLLTGSYASATRLGQQKSPRILHVATHGFFVADAGSKPQDPLRLIQDQAPQLNALRQEDPQLRSGLVLAGANQPDANPNDDGYLTALEAVTLNLKGTELVVLSACSTGQGDIRTGEGVYGLQRSLAVAGARSTLLSLWKVDDAATLEFMTRFYKRLKAGEGRAEALAVTQKEFRAGIPGKPEWKEPYYWAAWQLVGDWRPIPGL